MRRAQGGKDLLLHRRVDALQDGAGVVAGQQAEFPDQGGLVGDDIDSGAAFQLAQVEGRIGRVEGAIG